MKLVTIVLSKVEARVLGALIEKEITTPDYYPLSLNALVNACNQRNNRDPVMNLDEDEVRDVLRSLQEKRLAGPAGDAGSRVSKFEHRTQEVFNFTRAETAVMEVLLLRGPQTPGELRGRGERLHRFEELSDVQSTLQRLMERDPPMVRMLPRQPGTKESRYAHLLSGDVEGWEAPPESSSVGRGAEGAEKDPKQNDPERLARLENELTEMRTEIAELRQVIDNFRKQFE